MLDIWLALVLVAFAILPIFLATAARPTSAHKAAQAAAFIGVFVTALPVLLLARRQVTGAVLGVYGVMALFAAPAIAQTYFSLEWFLGDILLLSVPALVGIALCAAARERPKLPRTTLHVFVGCLFITAILASFFPDAADHNRYQAPAPLVMAGVWVYFFTLRGWRRAFAAGGIAVIAALTWGSQWRSSAAVFAFIGIVVVYFLLRGPARALFVLAVAFVLVTIVGFGIDPLPGGVESDENNRLVQTFQGGLANDSSTTFRFVEARAVWKTANAEWTFLNIPFGAGHGATYNFLNLEVLPQSHGFQERNSANGRVHNIHLGPAMIPYRYGIAGVAIVTYLLFVVARSVRSAGRRQDADVFMASLAVVGCAMLFVANNVTTQIHFTLTAAVLIPLIATAGVTPKADRGTLAGVSSRTRHT